MLSEPCRDCYLEKKARQMLESFYARTTQRQESSFLEKEVLEKVVSILINYHFSWFKNSFRRIFSLNQVDVFTLKYTSNTLFITNARQSVVWHVSLIYWSSVFGRLAKIMLFTCLYASILQKYDVYWHGNRNSHQLYPTVFTQLVQYASHFVKNTFNSSFTQIMSHNLFLRAFSCQEWWMFYD